MVDEKFILDATAGFRMMWFNKHEPHTIYLDQRPECEPDIVGDFRDLKQFPDETFRLIIFDPPHIIKNPTPQISNMERDFGSLRPDTWKNDLKQAFSELWRVLAPMGILLFKWNTVCQSTPEVMATFHVKPLVYQISSTRKDVYDGQKRKKDCQTLWFCFMKFPEQKIEHDTDKPSEA